MGANRQQVNVKVWNGNCILAKMRHFVPLNILKNMYRAFIAPQVYHGLIKKGGNASKSKFSALMRNLAPCKSF